MKAPELAEPGKKPTGPMEVDWQNPLTKGLDHFFFSNNHGVLDLVTNQYCVIGSGVDGFSPKYGGIMGMVSDTAGGVDTSNVGALASFAKKYDGSHPFTVTVDFFNDVIDANDQFIAGNAVFHTSGWRLYMKVSIAQLLFQVMNAGGKAQTSTSTLLPRGQRPLQHLDPGGLHTFDQ